MYFVYILECTDGSLYTGCTTDVARRFKAHSEGKGGHYTRAHPPKCVRYQERAESRSQALTREAEIKRLTREEKLALCSSV